MFFSFLKRPKKGNRRFRERKPEHVIVVQVQPSRKEVIMRRQKIAGHTLKWVVLGGLAAWGLTYAGGLWHRAFNSSGDFAVGQFELVTNGVITVSQVAAVTGLRAEQNITDLDLGEIRARLMELPRVSRADVERRLPNHLSIRLDERRPAAWLACAKQNLRPFDGRGLLLDSDGVAFPCGIVLEEYSTLPVIYCPDVSSVTPGRRVPLAMVKTALDLAQRIRRKNWATPMGLEQIHIINDFTLVTQMDTDALFTFLPADLDRQLARLDAILQKTGAAGRRVASVNLQLNRNVPVTFKEAAPLPSAPFLKPSPGRQSPADGPGSAAKRPAPVSANEEEVRSLLRGA
ncbi:MAG: FtsQ-type POTRA domain-containing protein [Verrucomicrobiota bacterium]